jgi:hypothetical protein
MNLQAKVSQLEKGAPQSTHAESIRRIARERYERNFAEYCDMCDQLLATIPTPYAPIVAAQLESLGEENCFALVYRGFLGEPVEGLEGLEAGPLLPHVLLMAKRAGAHVHHGAMPFPGPLELPAATCAILMESVAGEVEFQPASNGGWQCRECAYWLPFRRGEGWGKPLLEACPLCSGEPVNFITRKEIRMPHES